MPEDLNDLNALAKLIGLEMLCNLQKRRNMSKADREEFKELPYNAKPIQYNSIDVLANTNVPENETVSIVQPSDLEGLEPNEIQERELTVEDITDPVAAAHFMLDLEARFDELEARIALYNTKASHKI